MFRPAAFFALAVLAAVPARADNVRQILGSNRMAAGGAAWDGKQTLKVEYSYSGQGLAGSVSSLEDLRHDRFVDSYDTPPEAGSSGFDGERPWLKDSSGAVSYQEGGDTPQLSINEAYRNRNLWWRPDFGGATIVSAGIKQDGGTSYQTVTVTPKGGVPFDAWFDSGTHLLARTVEVDGPQTITTVFSDYRDIGGAKIVGKLVVEDGGGAKYAQTMTLKSARFLAAQTPAAYARPTVHLTDYSISGGTETTVPFRLMNNHVYAEVKVNGKGPFLFIFDTGGHNNLTPATAKAITLDVVGQEQGAGAGEGTVDEGEARVETLQIGDATVTHQLFGVLEFERPETAGYTTDGMVGVQTFRRFVTRFDYGARTITLIDPAHFDPRDAGTPIHVVFDGETPVVQGTFEGIPGSFDIDTGSRDELSLTTPFALAHNLRATHPNGAEAIDGWGVGGPTHAFVTMGKSLTIGPVEIDNVVTSFSIDKRGAFSAASYQGNIGSAILKRFAVTFDYGHQTMYLKRLAEPVADTGVFDRSGMWINTADDGFVVVSVTKGAAADQAGMKTGDTITAVDGAPSKSIALSDLRQRLRDAAPGTVVTLSVKSGGQARDVKVTLRDLF